MINESSNQMTSYSTSSWPSQLFQVSKERQACMDKQVSFCINPSISQRSRQVNFPSSACTNTSSQNCCSPVYKGGYPNPFPSYSPFPQDNSFFFRQDFPQFSFLPACSNIPSSKWTPPP